MNNSLKCYSVATDTIRVQKQIVRGVETGLVEVIISCKMGSEPDNYKELSVIVDTKDLVGLLTDIK